MMFPPGASYHPSMDFGPAAPDFLHDDPLVLWGPAGAGKTWRAESLARRASATRTVWRTRCASYDGTSEDGLWAFIVGDLEAQCPKFAATSAPPGLERSNAALDRVTDVAEAVRVLWLIDDLDRLDRSLWYDFSRSLRAPMDQLASRGGEGGLKFLITLRRHPTRVSLGAYGSPLNQGERQRLDAFGETGLRQLLEAANLADSPELQHGLREAVGNTVGALHRAVHGVAAEGGDRSLLAEPVVLQRWFSSTLAEWHRAFEVPVPLTSATARTGFLDAALIDLGEGRRADPDLLDELTALGIADFGTKGLVPSTLVRLFCDERRARG